MYIQSVIFVRIGVVPGLLTYFVQPLQDDPGTGIRKYVVSANSTVNSVFCFR